MRNLKRMLCLVLSVVMLVGMMMIGASAVSIKDFGDTDKITEDYAAAVDFLVQLGIINGNNDGNFYPQDTLTREQMAKIAFMVASRNRDDSLYKGASTLGDIAGRWSEGVIAWCNVNEKQIITGTPDGNFWPDGKLTVVECATMLLRALGYNNTLSGLTGTGWEIRAMDLAYNKGLMDGIADVKASDFITREQACQMAYNTLFADTIELVTKGYDEAGRPIPDKYGNVGNSLLLTNYNYKSYTGVLVANDTAFIEGSAAAKTGESTVKLTETDKDGNITVKDATTVKISSSLDLLGKEVTWCTFNSGAKISASFTETGRTKTEAFGTPNGKIAADKDTIAVVNYVVSNTAIGKGFTLVDVNKDGKAEYAFNTTWTFSQVTKKDDKNITITGLGVKKLADVAGSDTLEAGDYVNYTTVGAKAVAEKAPSVVGTVTAYSTKNGATVAGKTYKLASSTDNAKLGGEVEKADTYVTTLDLAKATEQTFYMNKNGQLVIAVGEKQASADIHYAYILNTSVTPDQWDASKKTLKVIAVLDDGTKGTYDVMDNSDTYKTGAEGEKGFYSKYTETTTESASVNEFWQYQINKDGKMIVLGEKAIEAVANNAAFENGKPTLTNVNGTYVNDNTKVVFFQAADPKTQAPEVLETYTGVKNIPDFTNQTVYVVADGAYASLLFVNGTPDKTVETDTVYAYALGGDATKVVGGWQYDFVVNGEKKTLTVESIVDASEDDMKKAPAKGTIFTATIDSETGYATLKAVDTITYATVAGTDGETYILVPEVDEPVYFGEDLVIEDVSATDSKGAIVPSVGTISEGNTVLYIKSTKGEIVKMYVIGTGTVEKSSVKGVDAVNSGVTVAVEDNKISFTGTLALYEKNTGDTPNELDKIWGGENAKAGDAPAGNYVAVKFTAPAGVVADSDYTLKYQAITTDKDGKETEGNVTPTDSVAVKKGGNSATLELQIAEPDPDNTKVVKVTVQWTSEIIETYVLDFSNMKWAK